MNTCFPGTQLAALIVATSFAAGLNVYATVGTLGLLSNAGVLTLPGSLHLVSNWWVIGACLALFTIELFADKIPAFDLVWNALHTFVRVPVAALLAFGATSSLSPQLQLLSTLAGAGIAFAAHGGKTAIRAAITPSPEPFTNIALSGAEDILAVFLTWLATKHPYLSAGIAMVFIVIILILTRWILRALRKLFREAKNVLSSSDFAA
ncbi:MAG TPA: DUF4126 domain-containing protein [Candidatus Saccharimonadales bacterium]|nr:DUF4126 domain-containing protein [Candidatus Saccharimonadales bacterium]